MRCLVLGITALAVTAQTRITNTLVWRGRALSLRPTERGSIQENQAQLKSVSSTLNGIRASNRDLKAATGRHEEALQSQQQLIDQVTSLELQLQQMLRSQRELVDKANVASQSLAQIEASLSPLVNENAEAVRAFDAFRISYNRRIVALERQFGQLQKPSSASVSTNPVTQ